eukprot:comp6314_c0_seq1/m.2123 comp6314_c0_seq1/g.2123  ORF comp6314_c0_seq1/g.2123 comp6314_c0_seq1/m.2123 type:complete len:311 (-) comp6314_c0_seq1:608-1540(-)
MTITHHVEPVAALFANSPLAYKGTEGLRQLDAKNRHDLTMALDWLKRHSPLELSICIQGCISAAITALHDPHESFVGSNSLWVLEAEGHIRGFLFHQGDGRDEDNYYFYADKKEDTWEMLHRAVPFKTNVVVVGCIPRDQMQHIKDGLSSYGPGLRVLYDEPAAVYFCKALNENFTMPQIEGIEFKPLRPEHASLVVERWKYSLEDSEHFVRQLITYVPSMAAYHQGQPISWALTYRYGSIGLAHTLPAWRRKGLAAAIVYLLAQALIEESGCASVFVADYNVASREMLKKVGFKFAAHTDWLATTPVGQ